ncbi:MAG TPA: DUF1906 domain-containing protein [Streptosporangiaceae bacterium]
MSGRTWRGRASLGALAGLAAAISCLSAGPAMAATAGQGTATPAAAAQALAAGGPVQTIGYHGYQFQVPASWPVYRLAADPTRCVLFNTHAVYLGTPGTKQDCPARAYGHAGAIVVQPLGARQNLTAGTVTLPAGTAALPANAALAARPAALAAASHVLRVAAPGPGVEITATYGGDLGQVRDILGTGTMTATAASPATSASSATAAATAASPSASATSSASPSPSSSAASSTTSLVDAHGSGLGFDACTAPSVQAMTDWLSSPYRTIGTYLGGDNWACSYGNFTSDWVQEVSAMGWNFIPIWVGPQASCSTIGGAVKINNADATAEGGAEAASAVTTAASFGYGTGTPIYFDMEGYSTSNSACVQGVLSFLAGWTEGLHAAGYLSGVYSSAGSGIANLASEFGSTSYTSPDDIWIADWTGNPVTATDPFLPDADWADHQRLHQYYGGHNETWGGTTINIDNDSLDGDVAASPAAATARAQALAAVPDAVTVSPGGTATVHLVLHASPPAGPGESGQYRSVPVRWQASAPAGLTITPSSGVTPVAPGRPEVVRLDVTASATAGSGRYDIPVTATAGAATLTESYELVSVLPAGAASLPTAHPVVLYAADPVSMAIADSDATGLGLPASAVTGNFVQAWNDVSAGKSTTVLAVGQAAMNALYLNPCGWTNPAGTGAGTTPFFYPGVPLTGPPGADAFEPADGSTAATTALLTTQLAHYAVAGTIPNDGGHPAGPNPPADTCLGSPDVPVP